MPISPERLLDLLEAPHWKTPGSTSRKPEGPTARRTEGAAAVNLTVVDHITAGRRVLAEAERIAAEGTALAIRKAEALRQAQALKSLALMGERTDVRRHACPYCGAYGLMLSKAGRAVCVNRHCAPAGSQRSWALVDLLMAPPGRPSGVRRSETRPRDDRDVSVIIRFLQHTGHPISPSQFRRMVRMYELPSWPSRTNTSPHALAYSLSDVLTAHALDAAKRTPSDCAQAQRPACDGLADAFFSDKQMGRVKVEEAKALCEGCPFREPCLEAALSDRDELQHGVRGGLTSKERRDLKTKQAPPRDRSKCTQGHDLTEGNVYVRPSSGQRSCLICTRASQQRYRKNAKTKA